MNAKQWPMAVSVILDVIDVILDFGVSEISLSLPNLAWGQ